MRTTTIFFVALGMIGCSGNGARDISASGTIEGTDVNIGAEAAGKLKELRVDEGSRVAGGDTLAIIDDAEYQIQLRQYGAERAKNCDLLPSRYDRVVEALGGFGALVTAAADLPDALQRAYNSGKPACINVMIESAGAPVIRTMRDA